MSKGNGWPQKMMIALITMALGGVAGSYVNTWAQSSDVRKEAKADTEKVRKEAKEDLKLAVEKITTEQKTQAAAIQRIDNRMVRQEAMMEFLVKRSNRGRLPKGMEAED